MLTLEVAHVIVAIVVVVVLIAAAALISWKSAINYQLYFSVNFYFYEKEKYQIVAKENLEKVPESIQDYLGNMTV